MNDACKQAILQVIEGVSKSSNDPASVTQTQQPRLFTCQSAPTTRLLSAKYVKILPPDLFLRSSAEKTNNMIRVMPKVEVEIVGGPVCVKLDGGAAVYWKIKFVDSNNETITGWLSEGDVSEYYLEPVRK